MAGVWQRGHLRTQAHTDTGLPQDGRDAGALYSSKHVEIKGFPGRRLLRHRQTGTRAAEGHSPGAHTTVVAGLYEASLPHAGSPQFPGGVGVASQIKCGVKRSACLAQVQNASSKQLRERIGSVANTQKITDAMKLVAAAKVRRAQDAVVNGRPFSENLVKVRPAACWCTAVTVEAGRQLHEATFLASGALWCQPEA